MPVAAELVPEDQVPLRGAELFPGARNKGAKLQFPDFRPDEAEGGMAHGSSHFSDLPVFSFCQLENDPGIGNAFSKTNRGIPGGQGGLGFQKPGPAWKGFASLDEQSLGKFFQGIGRWDSFDLGPIGPGVALFRIEQPTVQAGLITEEKKSFGVRIQPAEGIDVFGKAELGEGSVRGPIQGELGKHPVGFVKGQEHSGKLSSEGCSAKGS